MSSYTQSYQGLEFRSVEEVCVGITGFRLTWQVQSVGTGGPDGVQKPFEVSAGLLEP